MAREPNRVANPVLWHLQHIDQIADSKLMIKQIKASVSLVSSKTKFVFTLLTMGKRSPWYLKQL